MAIFVKFLSSIVGGLACAILAVMSSSNSGDQIGFGFLAFVIGSFLGLFFGRLIVRDSTKPTLPRESK